LEAGPERASRGSGPAPAVYAEPDAGRVLE
jgi:hypothetical protein